MRRGLLSSWRRYFCSELGPCTQQRKLTQPARHALSLSLISCYNLIMCTRLLAILFLLASAPLWCQTPTYATITASGIKDAFGSLLAAGKLCLTPVAQKTGLGTDYAVFGDRQRTDVQGCTPVTKGTISPRQVTNTSATWPGPACYRAEVDNVMGAAILGVNGSVNAQGTLQQGTVAAGTGTRSRITDWSDAMEYCFPYRGIVNVLDCGADASGLRDSTAAIQAGINAAIAIKGKVIIPSGTYTVSSSMGGSILTLHTIAQVNNTGQFGIEIEGAGMGTAIIDKTSSGLPHFLFDFDAGEMVDQEIHMRNLQIFDQSGMATCLALGTMSRYSGFDNIRMHGCSYGISFRRSVYGLTFRSIYIRGSRKSAIWVDSANLGTNGYITEARFEDGYFDNNGLSTAQGGARNPVVSVYHFSSSHWVNNVFEGNYGGGLYFIASGNQEFLNNRFEEVRVRQAAGLPIHYFDATSATTSFINSDFIYDYTGGGNAASYPLFNFQSGPVLIKGGVVAEISGSNPGNLFGATPFSVLGQTSIENVLNGVCNAGTSIQTVQWPSVLALWASPTCTGRGMFLVNGSPVISMVASISLMAQQANVGLTRLYAVPTGGSGLYRLSCYTVLTQAATSSSTLPRCQISYTDGDSSISKMLPITQASDSNTVGAIGEATGFSTFVISPKEGTNIQFQTDTYASSGATSMQYAVRVKAEYLGQ